MLVHIDDSRHTAYIPNNFPKASGNKGSHFSKTTDAVGLFLKSLNKLLTRNYFYSFYFLIINVCRPYYSLCARSILYGTCLARSHNNMKFYISIF